MTAATHAPAAPLPGPAVGRRVRVTGDLYHGQVPDGAVYIGRAAPGLPASPYANPFSVRQYGLAGALRRWERYLDDHPELISRARAELAGRDVACWCKLPVPGLPDLCHGAILLSRIRTEVTS
ncbi:DUF4326 domain-containing protein [Streptosporangium sandarakinum]